MNKVIEEQGIFCPMDKKCNLDSSHEGNLKYSYGTYTETWICNRCNTEFKIPVDFDTENGEIDCDTIERHWDEGTTLREVKQ
tara:strand:+ start:1451 stop:1696 length:246 start_codon:yes stop_codon:yes gene_type:complete